MLATVQQATIKQIIEATVTKGSLIYTDEYNIYARLPAWGYSHKTVCHGQREYARDEDSDGFCEAHVNTMEDTVNLADFEVEFGNNLASEPANWILKLRLDQ